MDEVGAWIVFCLICMVVGFFGGGVYGLYEHIGWFPQAWYGLGGGFCVAAGLPIIAHGGCH